MKRTKILFAWEVGANFGHVSKICEVVGHLSKKFDVVIVARNPIAVRKLYPDLPVTLLPTPFHPTRALFNHEAQGQSYPGVLRTEGWDSAENLIALIEAWRSLFDLVKPSILVAQAAPTAMLAARGLDLKTVILGSGYDTPPRTTPMQTFQRGDNEADALALEQETDALGFANTALAHFKAPELAEFSDLLDVDLTLLASLPQLDHYSWRDEAQPEHAPYLGQIFTTNSGAKVSWRNRGAPRILAYLRHNSPHFAVCVQALAQLGPNNDIILASPGINPVIAQQLSSRSVIVVDGPVRLDPLLPDCNLGVSHGANGTVAAFLSAGVPQLCIPNHREQMMCASALADAGLGLGIAGKFGPDQVVKAISQTLRSENITKNALETQSQIKKKGLDKAAKSAAKMLIDLALS